MRIVPKSKEVKNVNFALLVEDPNTGIVTQVYFDIKGVEVIQDLLSSQNIEKIGEKCTSAKEFKDFFQTIKKPTPEDFKVYKV